MTVKEENLKLLTFIAEKLEELRDEVVFLGGTANAVLVTDPVAPDLRRTVDVDCIMDVENLNHYHRFTSRLAEKGFKQIMDEPVICRWFIESVSLDVMPTDESILGFGNYWAKPAVSNADIVTLDNKLSIKIVSPAYFLATKLEAFKDRGNNDYLCSHDLEDIITLIDGRPDIVTKIQSADQDIKQYLKTEFSNLLSDRDFTDALPGHLNYGGVLSERLNLMMNKLGALTEL